MAPSPTPARSARRRGSIGERRASMRRFEQLHGRILVGLSAAGALAMAAFISLTTHLLG